MHPIKQITISGFRGILAPLELDFTKGKSIRSMVIYGRNGTGKSSITDAWEWIHKEKIQHLAREGAGPRSYPHKNAEPGNTFVEIEFSENALPTMRLEYDFDRITMPRSQDDIKQFRSLAPHPCHIRFEDLTRFVYLTKAEKHDELAQLMGFTPQVELQKALRRVQRQLHEKLESRSARLTQSSTSLKKKAQIDQLSKTVILKRVNAILDQYGITCVESVNQARTSSKLLTEKVKSDPRAQELADLKTIKNAIGGSELTTNLTEGLNEYIDLVDTFRSKAQGSVELLLIGLYENGLEVLRRRDTDVLRTQMCPLCGQYYQEGDLVDHITEELRNLQELKELRDKIESKRRKVQRKLRDLEDSCGGLAEIGRDRKSIAESWSLDSLSAPTQKLKTIISNINERLNTKPENIDSRFVETVSELKRDCETAIRELVSVKQAILNPIIDRLRVLQDDDSRAQLVSDHTTLLTVLDLWDDYLDAKENQRQLSVIYANFKDIVEDYIESSINNVRERFETISEDVEKYFRILEHDASGISKPTIKLLVDQDRAVVLEVEFYGEAVSPAYRYLSESQLNSFGLSVFLASAKRFNPEFKFLIMDDVINSFDGYKRPRVIELLKQEFSEHQILLLTHDRVWRDRVYEMCPSWVRLRFNRWEIGSGPVVREGAAPLDMIKKRISDDEPKTAGQMMGPFLERQLQELCEAFEVLVKYNQRNEYTLDPLLTRFRMRVKDKLTKNHELYTAIEELQGNQGFRNLCAHWKRPDIQITPEEMQDVVDKWEAVEGITRCQDCHSFVRYDGRKGFECWCKSTRLDKPQS